jgi:hypothetical protein
MIEQLMNEWKIGGVGFDYGIIGIGLDDGIVYLRLGGVGSGNGLGLTSSMN